MRFLLPGYARQPLSPGKVDVCDIECGNAVHYTVACAENLLVGDQGNPAGSRGRNGPIVLNFPRLRDSIMTNTKCDSACAVIIHHHDTSLTKGV